MAERYVVWWDDVSREAEPIFRMWTDARELEWAKESWEALGKRGLTSYSDEVERTLVFVRLMALAGIYLDFCELAFDEIHDAAYTMWASDLCLSTFRVAQCVGPQFSKDEDADDNQLLEDALRELMDKARSDIHEVLRSKFGDDSLLFVSLWNTVECERNELGMPVTRNSADVAPESSDQTNREVEKGRIDWREDAGGILNCEITGQKLAAFTWIEQGMQSLH
jgi:hypothetical protein